MLPTVQALNSGVTPSIVEALTCKHIWSLLLYLGFCLAMQVD